MEKGERKMLVRKDITHTSGLGSIVGRGGPDVQLSVRLCLIIWPCDHYLVPLAFLLHLCHGASVSLHSGTVTIQYLRGLRTAAGTGDIPIHIDSVTTP